MSSSTSSSERRWKRFLRVYAAVLLAAGLAGFALVVVVDPYNTGMLTPLDRHLRIHDAPRFAHAGRARDPDFDSAIFGNSTGQLLDPARLDQLIGGRFASLIIPGSGPVEQLVLLDYFLRHHAGNARTLVLTMDSSWCAADRYFTRERINNPFPFWLYDGDRLAYLANLVTPESIRQSRYKLSALLGRGKLYGANGYDNFELGRMWRIEEAWERLDGLNMGWMSDNDRATVDDFAAFDALETRLARISKTRIVIAFTPYYAPALPHPGSLTAERLDKCKRRAAGVAGAGSAAFLDFLQDDRMTRDPANFWDPPHYRSHIARLIENAIAAAVASRDD